MDYPEFNPKWKKWGRVKEISVRGPHLVLGLDSGSLQAVYRQEYEAIQVNDWVAVDENEQLVRVVVSQKMPIKSKVRRENLQNWNKFLRLVRLHFESQDFLELQTPSLVGCPGTEPALDVFTTQLKIANKVKDVFLPTSPELHLKKALGMGFEKIFEIAKCYRNNEVTDFHQPEFWMLEWYRSFANLFHLQADVVKLIYFLCDQFKVNRPDVKCFTVHQLFKRHLGFELGPHTTYQEYKELALLHGLNVSDSYSIDDIFFLLMLEKIEPFMRKDTIVFVEKYPPFQAALARKDEKGWAQRFEVYWKGMELANAFDELNDPVEQRNRAQHDLQKREGRTPIALDEEFFAALESGMPPSAGIALGLERLFMALMDVKQIQYLRLFPVSP